MIFLSILLVPVILFPLLFSLPLYVLVFFDICDLTILVLFIAEYCSKLYFAPNRWAHFKSPWHIVDLIIILLPFIQYFPLLDLGISGSPSLLLRLLRLPRAFAVGSRAVAGRRTVSQDKISDEEIPPTIIRQIDLAQKTLQENLTWDDLRSHLSDNSTQEWIDIHNISDDGFAVLSDILQISELHFKSGLVDVIYPHIDYVQQTSFVFLQSGKIVYPEQADHYLTISRSGIITVCNGTKIITISRHSIDMFDEVLCSVYCNSINGSYLVPVLYGILEKTLESYKSILSEIEIEIIQIGRTPKSKLPKDFLARIYQLNKEVSRLISNLIHFKEMLSTITSKKVPLKGFDQSSEEAFKVLQEGAMYLNEIASDLMENLRSIIDLYINQTSFETNRILKVLAVITSISVIPTAVGGLLGMNLVDVPFSVYLWEVVFIIGITMTFAAYVFTKLGWLKT